MRFPSLPSPRVPRPAAIGLAALAVAAAPAAAQDRDVQTRDAFQWSGRVEAGRVLHVRNLNGPVRVERGGGDLEIRARKRWRRGDPERVTVEMRRLGGDIIVCAVWEGGTCEPDGYRARPRGARWTDEDDISVEFLVRVPEGVRLDLHTTNGGLEIDGATAEVVARTTNGSIRARSLGGPVQAKTVNGSINVRMGNLGSEDLSYETVNGSITLEVPADLRAELSMRTVNGRVDSEFPLTVQGRINPRNINASIGGGGRRIEVRTVNGSVTLKRAG